MADHTAEFVTTIKRQWYRLHRWYIDPFRTKVHYHEATRIEHRQWPYKLKLQAVEPLQDRINRVAADGGGTVMGGEGTYLLSRGITVPPSAERLGLVGFHLDGRGLRNDPALRVQSGRSTTAG